MVHYALLSGARDLKNGCLKMAASNSMSPGSGAPATIDDSHASPLGTIRTLHLQMSLRKSTLISRGLPKKLSATQNSGTRGAETWHGGAPPACVHRPSCNLSSRTAKTFGPLIMRCCDHCGRQLGVIVYRKRSGSGMISVFIAFPSKSLLRLVASPRLQCSPQFLIEITLMQG
jgi:hypothetical protein